ncbi:hypothetical protein [Amycolatopsis taiwanensis]|uniref:hypothetical protein n=1 Tax=Amycolatopsis taiwanensis TaxID=342230 RepID=UPI0004BA183F|nr:hypothetical protein [Amycolatopsis taiwanensis]
MTIFSERVAALRAAAQDGDAGAAREYGRLLSLLPDGNLAEDGPFWAGEPWLRAAVTAHPHDTLARTLLGSLLVTQTAAWRNLLDIVAVAPGAEEEEIESANTRRREEAEELLGDVLREDPEAPTPKACLAALAEVFDERDYPESDFPYDYHLVRTELWSGSVCTTFRLVVADPEELRWACDYWLANYDEFVGPLTLTSYSRGKEIGAVDLLDGSDAIDWEAVAVPPLTGVPLPPGHPAPQWRVYYGFTVEVSP